MLSILTVYSKIKANLSPQSKKDFQMIIRKAK